MQRGQSVRFTAAFVAAICAAPPATAQAQAQAWAKMDGWTVNRGAGGCGLTNNSATAPFALSETLSGHALVRFTLKSGKLAAGQPFALRIDSPKVLDIPAKATVHAGESKVGADGRSGELLMPPGTDLYRFQNERLTAVDPASAKTLGTVAADGLEPAAAVLIRCMTELRRVEPGSAQPAAKPPRAVRPLPSLFNGYDYPSAASRKKIEGTSIISLTVSAGGKISECRIVETSGNDHLDEAGCKVLSRRARFLAATDADGAATEGTLTYPAQWRMAK